MHRIPDYEKLRQILGAQFALGPDSIHGPGHWRRVERFGVRVAELEGAAPEALVIVRLFAVFHDCRRDNESWDPEHGLRGSRMAETLRGKHFELGDEDFERLRYACAHHTGGMVSDDPAIGACWDADRLDLMRLGVTPNRKLLSTAAAREPRTIDWAWQLVLEDRRKP